MSFNFQQLQIVRPLREWSCAVMTMTATTILIQYTRPRAATDGRNETGVATEMHQFLDHSSTSHSTYIFGKS